MPPRLHDRPLPGLRYWRVKCLLSQQALSDKAGCSVATVARIERGYPATPLMAEKLAHALDLPTALLTKEPPE